MPAEQRVRLTEVLYRMERRAAELPAGHPERERLTDLAWALRRHLAGTPNLAAVRSMLDRAATEPTDAA